MLCIELHYALFILQLFFIFLDNWAMIYAQKVAMEHSMPLYVCFALPEKFREATIRQYGFMLKGLQEVEKVISLKNTTLVYLLGVECSQ